MPRTAFIFLLIMGVTGILLAQRPGIWGGNEGWLPELISEVARERPKRPDVQAVYREYAAALVSEAKRKDIDARVTAAYVKFGLAPPVNVQQGGQGEATVPATDAVIIDTTALTQPEQVEQIVRLARQQA